MNVPERKSVFLNVPFDSRYESLFIALVGTLVFLGHSPHCVLEVREKGDGRLSRIFELMRECRISIHDLSRAGTPARFNMPFELGLACALKLTQPADYELLVLDSKHYRIDRTLSDYKGRDPLIHNNRISGVVSCLLDAFASDPVAPVAEIRRSISILRQSAENLKREFSVKTIFTASLFRSLVIAAGKIGIERGLSAP